MISRVVPRTNLLFYGTIEIFHSRNLFCVLRGYAKSVRPLFLPRMISHMRQTNLKNVFEVALINVRPWHPFLTVEIAIVVEVTRI